MTDLKPGTILFCVMAENHSNEPNRLLSAAVGLAVPADKSVYGYLSEHHSFGETDEKAGEFGNQYSCFLPISFRSYRIWAYVSVSS